MGKASLWQIIQSRWRLVLAFTLTGLVLSAIVSFFLPVKYAANAVLYISSQGAGASSSDAYQGGLLSEQRVKSYVELIQGERIAAEVVQQLRLPERPSDLADNISATAQTDSVVIQVSALADSPQNAVAIANEASRSFTNLVAELERPVDSNRPPAVVARIVQPATVTGDGAVEPRVLTNILVGAFLGAVIGVAIAVLRVRLDVRIHTGDQLAAALECANLGTTLTEQSDVSPLAVVVNPHSPGAEAYRLIRTNLQYMDIEKTSKIVLVTSTSPGEGKTVTSCNIAASLADAGARVLLLEADLRAPTFSKHVNVESAVGLSNILRGSISLRQAVQKVRAGGMIDVVPSGPLPPNPNELISSQRMNILLQEARQDYEFVIVDGTPVGAVADAISLAPMVDGVVIASKSESTTLPQAIATRDALVAVNAKIYGCILTMSKQSNKFVYGTYGNLASSGHDGLDAPLGKDVSGQDATTTRTPTSPHTGTPSPRPSRRP